jgi:zinc protease
MRFFTAAALLLLLCFAAMAQKGKAFPYAYTIDDLPNGLRLVTVPTDYPNLVAVYIVVQTGSRNEIEPGKTGYAHFFEHLMFRGSKNYTSAQRDAILKKAGADPNAYTSDDRTVYHEVVDKSDLAQVIGLEADRFKNLKYSQDQFKTESKAVLGEYNKNNSNPFNQLYEKLRETAFGTHTYAHTTMGYVKDIEDFPNQFEYSWQFWSRYYRPEYTTIVVVGDTERAKALALVKQNFGDWKRGDYVPKIPAEPAQNGPRTANVDWPAPTQPYLVVAYHGPAYSDTTKDKAALDILATVAFGDNSDLYQKLVLREQKVDFVQPGFDDQVDPELFSVFARIKEAKDMDYVRDEILATIKRYSTELIPQDELNNTRSHLRYSFLLQMDSSEAIASALAPFISLRRTPETINKVYALYDQITPEDVRAAAQKYLTENQRTIVTLASKSNAGGAK